MKITNKNPPRGRADMNHRGLEGAPRTTSRHTLEKIGPEHATPCQQCLYSVMENWQTGTQRRHITLEGMCQTVLGIQLATSVVVLVLIVVVAVR